MITKTRAEVTKNLENAIFNQTRKMGTFGCFEVTIGFGGNERVDYMTYNTRGDIRCYEIKSSKEDFYSDAKWSFVGNYNYFVLTQETYEQVKHDIPKGIGVYIDGRTIKRRATRKEVSNVSVILESMIRSLYREFEKSYWSENIRFMQRLKRENSNMKNQIREAQKLRNMLSRIRHIIRFEKDSEEIKEIINEVLEDYQN